MKILGCTLLFIIFINLDFAQSTGQEAEASSSKRYRGGRPVGRKSRRLDGAIQGEFRITPKFRTSVAIKDESDEIIDYKGLEIEVWLDTNKTKVLKADYPGNKVPIGRDYATKNFLVRLATLRGTLQIVEYVNQNGTLLAVRAPRPTYANVMEPNESQWFIVYGGKYFRVRLDPETKAVKSITLASKNENDIVLGQRVGEVDIAGFKFFVIRGPPYSEITGAEYAGVSSSTSIS